MQRYRCRILNYLLWLCSCPEYNQSCTRNANTTATATATTNTTNICTTNVAAATNTATIGILPPTNPATGVSPVSCSSYDDDDY